MMLRNSQFSINTSNPLLESTTIRSKFGGKERGEGGERARKSLKGQMILSFTICILKKSKWMGQVILVLFKKIIFPLLLSLLLHHNNNSVVNNLLPPTPPLTGLLLLLLVVLQYWC